MIKVTSLTKRFKEREVLKSLNYQFPKTGLCIIYGQSGSGKTTFLNCLAGLLSFEGSISFGHISLENLSDNELSRLRLTNYGFVFQDFKLFDNETVLANLLFPLETIYSLSKDKKQRKCQDLLALVGLLDKEKQVVNKLSGGEKQRVAIARALANSPSVLLADEPTGNLDEKNSTAIMEILAKVSTSSLVIMVSHDETIVNEYGDIIISMIDGEIKNISYRNKKKHNSYLPIVKLKYEKKRRALPLKFLMSHTLNAIRRRKWRTSFITLSTSLGLIGIGLATVLKDIVSTNLYRSYSSIIDKNKLVVSSKDNSFKKDEVMSASFDEVNEIYEEYQSDISHIGIYYWNCSYLFETDDYLSLDSGGYNKPFASFSSAHINEFKLLSELNDPIYPKSVSSLTNDEVIISIPNLMVSELCFQLQIPRTIKSLSNYIEHNDVTICFTFSNENWGYSVEIPLHLRAFVLSNKQLLYHSNPFWNEYIFETMAHLPSTENITTNSIHPWDLIKSYYLEFYKNRDSFLINNRFSLERNEFDYELLDKKYYPNLLVEDESYEAKRVMVVKRSNRDEIPSFIGEYTKHSSKDVNKIIYGSSVGYAIYEQSLMMGFARNVYVSRDEQSILDISDSLSYLKYEDSQLVNLPDEIVGGHFTKSGGSGLVFEPSYTLIRGREPVNYHEIIISNALAERFGLDDPMNKIIHFAYPIKEDLLNNGYLLRDFKTIGLKVVGIGDSGKLSFSHNEAWTILFFQTMLGVSTFELRINTLAIEINEGSEKVVIDQLNRAFPFLNVDSPLSEIKESVEKVCYYIELITLIVSITSIVIAAFILFICNYLHSVEVRKDIGLIRCLGVCEKESAKFVYFHSFLMGGISTIFSFIELLIISFVLSKAFASVLLTESIFVFNPMALVYMFAVAFLISLFSSSLISYKTTSLNPIECLQ